MQEPHPITDHSTWTRILYMLLFALAFQLVELLMALVVAVQLLSKLFTGDTFAELRTLGDRMASYARDILRFMMFSTDELPFPFSQREVGTSRPQEGPIDQTAGV